MLRRSFLKMFGAASVALAVGAHQFKRREPVDSLEAASGRVVSYLPPGLHGIHDDGDCFTISGVYLAQARG
jgi:hypothetical protein